MQENLIESERIIRRFDMKEKERKLRKIKGERDLQGAAEDQKRICV